MESEAIAETPSGTIEDTIHAAKRPKLEKLIIPDTPTQEYYDEQAETKTNPDSDDDDDDDYNEENGLYLSPAATTTTSADVVESSQPVVEFAAPTVIAETEQQKENEKENIPPSAAAVDAQKDVRKPIPITSDIFIHLADSHIQLILSLKEPMTHTAVFAKHHDSAKKALNEMHTMVREPKTQVKSLLDDLACSDNTAIMEVYFHYRDQVPRKGRFRKISRNEAIAKLHEMCGTNNIA